MSMDLIDHLEKRAGVRLFDYQREVLEAEHVTDADSLRACLYYRTGAGKSLTGLLLVAQADAQAVVVVAPPSTHDTWLQQANVLGLNITTMSHAKFRMKDTKLSRTTAVIVDEFHMLGGHTGKGWKKMDTLAKGLQAPLIIMSATPNYNDAERVYCIQHVLDPHSCKGGFIEFIYQHCETEQNPYGSFPKVTGFRNHEDAAEYLASLPHVYYVPDELVWSIEDVDVFVGLPDAFVRYGMDRRRGRIFASDMERRHSKINHQLIDENGGIRDAVWAKLSPLLKAGVPTLIFANHFTVAEALSRTLSVDGYNHALITGKTSTKNKAGILQDFRSGESFSWLIGTSSLATGTDGLDKVCDNLIILDDTDDDSLRRQLVGRIMPRGADADASKKQVHRLVVS